MISRLKAPVMATAVAVLLSGCDILDVENPNNLVEESVQLESGANGVVNGSLELVTDALADIWEGPEVVSDNLYWIGSRDAWGSLDNGFIQDELNEFLDAAFPTLGQGVWMAQNAVEIMEGHVANNPGDEDFALDLARAQFFRGVILMVIAEVQQDMTFSFKQVDGAPVSSGNAAIGSEGQIPVASMDAVMGVAIQSLTEARNAFQAMGDDARALDATALLARAEMSRVILSARNSVGGALAFPNAVPHAQEVLASGSAEYKYLLKFNSTTGTCDMCSNISDRKENQIDLSIVSVDSQNDVDGIVLLDPITGEPDVAIRKAMDQFRGGSFLDSGIQFPDVTVSSARLMHLILAEDALATSGGGAGSMFETHINNLRALDAVTPFASDGVAANDLAILQHHRRVNTFLMGLRLQDMYRWGIQPGPNSAPSARWQNGSAAVNAPGTMLPITIIEVRANCHLNGQGCG